MDVLNEGSVHTEYGADAAAQSSNIWDNGPSIEYIGNPTKHDQNSRLIGELRDHIAKMKHQMKLNEEIHAREIAFKDQEIDSLNETVFVLLSTIIWSGTIMGCSVFVEDIRQVMVDSAIFGNVIDAYAEVLSIEQGSMPDEMQGDCTQVTNKIIYVFTCSFLVRCDLA
ncbi:hypothetical protein RHGRI_016548 [Rhododendron griersonianum]|uniref:Uncharacterized protein n=1 Tax=Rhododendron griersonianum TaxID=479676 RepID=A0AAV6JUJ9_9ERIC|nr:hypothetical protein RHGRI_016548 [Rhododendron griersonianum]